MFPIAMEFNLSSPYFHSKEICIIGALYYVSGIFGAIVISQLVLHKYCTIKFWSIFVALATLFASESVDIIVTIYKRDYKDPESEELPEEKTLHNIIVAAILLDGFFRVAFFSICFLYLLKITPAKSYHNIWNSLPGVLILIMSAILCIIQILSMALNNIE